MKRLKLFLESLNFAVKSLAVNKIRTILSLMGITIGIFSIISVFTLFDSLRSNITSEINSLGSNVLFIQKWPWAMGGNYPWWKYYQRPQPKPKEVNELLKRSYTIEQAAFMFGINRNVYYHDNSMENINIMAVSYPYNQIMTLNLQAGRYFTEIESKSGKSLAIIGSKVASNLFGKQDPIGKKIKAFGRKLTVIGVIKKKGSSIFGNQTDNEVLVPLNFALGLVNINKINTTIIVKVKPNISLAGAKSEITGIMRSIRSIRPGAANNFAINQTDIITKGMDSLFAILSIVGWIIGGFSLLVGGFGIANIMFVSVKERTNQIGIQKALGAKKYFILNQFLFEAIFLAVLGGIIGLLIVFILTIIASPIIGFPLTLTVANIILGVSVSGFIGLIAGLIPAWSAANLDPVEAMRTTF